MEAGVDTKDALWGKKSDKGGQLRWLPLMVHLEDTMEISALLWEQWLSEGQRKSIMDALSGPVMDDIASYEDLEELAKNTARFLGAVHDIGKATPVFQSKNYHSSPDLQSALMEKLENVGFRGISNLSLLFPEKTYHAVASQFLLSQFGVKSDIAAIAGGHHGKPVDSEEEICDQGSYKKNYYQTGKESNIYEKWERTQESILSWALTETGFDEVDNLPHIKQSGQVLLYGLLIMADWLSSNENYFPLIDIDANGDSIDRLSRTGSGWIKWRKDQVNWIPGSHSKFSIDELYENLFRFPPRDFQKTLAGLIEQIDKPGIVIIEAPMGLGKTEAALVASMQLAAKTGRGGIFFGLPTQATSDGIFLRIEHWLHNMQKNEEGRVGLRLSHGKAALNPDFASLASGVNIDGSEGKGLSESVVINEWFSGRKTATLDDFVVGTVDQFLLSALKQKHLALRHLGFSKKVVIIDEVHAYDAYMSVYLYEAIRWMGAYGVPVVILSATLPVEKRKKFTEEYLRGMGIKWRDTICNDDLETAAYPLITFNDGKKIIVHDKFENRDEKTVIIKRLDEENLYKLLEEVSVDGGVIGIIVNTLKKSQNLTRKLSELFGDENVELLHSGFIATERVAKEKHLIEMIGKDAKRPNFKIIVGTQVIEQSLDIDFDLLISELAPMDLIIQRIGRLHRHKNTRRPNAFKNPVAYVMGTDGNWEFDEGSSYVYGDYLLARTQYFLPDEIRIPGDISPLVQKVYEGEDIDIKDDLREKYLEFKKANEVKINSQKNRAGAYIIDNPFINKEKYFDLTGWIKNQNPNESEEAGYAQVRYIVETIEVIALKKIGNGYGLFNGTEDLSSHIGDFQVAKEIAKNTLKLPNELSRPYKSNYDKSKTILEKTIDELEAYTLDKLNTWQETNWLKGTLGILFDEKGEFILNGYKIRYSQKYGISAEKIGE
jgi:CRISPR-associated endonuclease/helicase Cas3